ncbi:glycoside hydrolase family 3 protein [Heterobasidion irregulare TC 32-1]|uniref:beta-glucosidase n=1 Tax=Heterobasidion irregulare (strain TC 32-1) TaxID=747525 RepID=W4KBG6_HETIT|nr:glycoside hydrolase family 3 protein [Heterobasidion irregulare TC 32-1]ETW82695.1 glycoside hydrolase family 3 protein [Heterobasidion irregulare TC 32-1]
MLRLALLALASSAAADVITRIPDAAPPGFEQWTSPIVVPAKPVAGDADWAPAVARARAFVGGLSLEEKVNLTTGVGTGGRCVGNTGEVTRIGFKGICLQDSPLGVRDADFASAFPAGINVAATFDRSLIYRRGRAMGAEHRGKGVNVALGPMTNMGRVAAGGRNWEGFGADPFLSGVASAETVRGVQDAGVIACVKHFIGNEQEHFRGGSEAPQVQSSNIDDKTMHEVYAWPFAEAVAAGVGSVMCSYNKVNQTQACQNSKILNGLLKEELDFQGFVTSDWAAMIDGVQPALAGADMNMPGFISYNIPPSEPNPDNTTNSRVWWGSALIEAVRNGSVPEARVTDMVVRTMAAYYKMGQDAPDFPAVNFDYNTEDTYLDGQLVNEHVNVQGDHYKLIREIGAASVVLLKNTAGALPLSAANIKRLAIVGSDAGPNPDGPNGCSDRGCDQGTLAMGWGSGTANFPYLVDPLSAIQSFVHRTNPTAVVEGVLSDFNYAQITAVAAQADTCIAFANADSGEGYITVDTNAGDRNNLTLWHAGDALVAATATACANTIVVLHAVGPVLLEPWIAHPNVSAVLLAGLPGQESGNALVDVLFGAVSPSGRLPYTIAKARGDYPADVLYESEMETPQITYAEGVDIDYRHFDAAGITPRFEFGFGLSYSTFATASSTATSTGSAPPAISSPAQTHPGGPARLFDALWTVRFALTNTGATGAHEVAQVYLTFPPAAAQPPKVLRGFERVYLDAGETGVVEVGLRRKDVSVWDVVKQEWVVPAGAFTVLVGSSSRNIHLSGTFVPGRGA